MSVKVRKTSGKVLYLYKRRKILTETLKKVTKVSKKQTKTLEFLLHFDPEKQKVAGRRGRQHKG